MFMASAGHVDKDIKPLVAQLSETHPEVHLELLTPVGEDSLFPGLIATIVSGSSEPI
jgi:sirohydrochlorin ferrochelatase